MRLNPILLCLLLASSITDSTNASAQQPPFINGEPLFVSPVGAGVLRGPIDHPIVGTVELNEIAVDRTGDGPARDGGRLAW